MTAPSTSHATQVKTNTTKTENTRRTECMKAPYEPAMPFRWGRRGTFVGDLWRNDGSWQNERMQKRAALVLLAIGGILAGACAGRYDESQFPPERSRCTMEI